MELLREPGAGYRRDDTVEAAEEETAVSDDSEDFPSSLEEADAADLPF